MDPETTRLLDAILTLLHRIDARLEALEREARPAMIRDVPWIETSTGAADGNPG